MEIVIIGSGNVATAIGRKMLSAGHSIIQVFSRNRDHARILADLLRAKPVSSLNEIEKKAEFLLIAISDNAYPSFLAEFRPTDSFLVHTAASVPMGIFKNKSTRYGVLYPLQSFRRELETSIEFPLLIDANNKENLLVLEKMAKGLSKTVVAANDDTRLKYHLGAVFVNNFTNHLFTLTESWCRQEAIDFSLLKPLIQETFSRLEYALPENLQTGPAIRNDSETLAKHRHLLKPYPELSRLYDALTHSIGQFHAGTEQ